MNNDSYTGVQKAAILLITLGPEKAATIFKHLKEDEIEELTLEIANTRSVSPQTKEEVLETSDKTQRQALYRDILTRLHNDAVYLPISYISMMVVARPELGDIPYAPIAAEIPFEQITPVKP